MIFDISLAILEGLCVKNSTSSKETYFDEKLKSFFVAARGVSRSAQRPVLHGAPGISVHTSYLVQCCVEKLRNSFLTSRATKIKIVPVVHTPRKIS